MFHLPKNLDFFKKIFVCTESDRLNRYEIKIDYQILLGNTPNMKMKFVTKTSLHITHPNYKLKCGKVMNDHH